MCAETSLGDCASAPGVDSLGATQPQPFGASVYLSVKYLQRKVC